MSNDSHSSKPTLRTVTPLSKQEAESRAVLPIDHTDDAASGPAPKSRAPKFLRVTAVLIIGLVLIICTGATWFYWTAHQALPQMDGKVSVRGLFTEAKVIRDARGVPHIVAENAEDLFFAQGYVTAQDRLWQMDLSRRLAGGTASEAVGSVLLDRDKEQRILGLREVAERSWQALSMRDRSHFEAYARGVNAFLESHRENLPIEFRVLRYSPKPWTGIDSLLCGILMSEALNHGLFATKLAREEIASKLGPELAVDLYPNSSWRDHPPGVDEGVATESNLSLPADANPSSNNSVGGQVHAASPAPEDVFVPGSNNWVVSGRHTVTGKPLLANDMHLGLQIPNTWYEAQLEIRAGNGEPGFDVAGFTLPGLPYVLVGHNRRIAWGFTNLEPDVEDVFVENVRADGEYQTPDGWRPMERRREVILVKGKPSVVFDVMLTRHGPVITGLIPHEKRTVVLKWSVYDDPVTVPFFDMDAAQNWPEFRQALSHFSGPAQNIVYADVDGHIGYQAAGHIPLRRSGDGSLPVNGSDNSHEWAGYIPFGKLPSVYDPPSGVIATANGRIAPDKYVYSISTQWGPPYRTERIYDVLNSQEKFAAEDMLKLQADTYSVFDRFCGERFVSAVSHSPKASARARKASELMQKWNGWVSPDLAAPTLITQARQQLLQLLLEPKLGPANGQSADIDMGWTHYHWSMSSVALENILRQEPRRWLPDGYATYEDLLTAAVEKTVTQKNAPGDLASWKWAGQVLLRVQHPLFGQIPILNRWSGPDIVPQSGDEYTVKQTGSRFGPSERMTVDLANLDASNFNLLTGQSGQLFSPHYMDQWRAWYEGFAFPMAFSDIAVAKGKTHELTLVPQ